MVRRFPANGHGNGDPVPPMKEVTVRDLLSDAQVKKCVAILNKTPDDTEAVARLREYLEKFHKDLVIKGVVPAYLAYYFIYLRNNGQLE